MVANHERRPAMWMCGTALLAVLLAACVSVEADRSGPFRFLLQEEEAPLLDGENADTTADVGETIDTLAGLGEAVDTSDSNESTDMEELRILPEFEYVTSCVPINILVLAQTEADLQVEGNDESIAYGAWIEAEADVRAALKTEVMDGTLHVFFVGANAQTFLPVKVVIYAPEDSLKGVNNAGIISTTVVVGFSPTGDFQVNNTSPLGALIIDDLKTSSDSVVTVTADGSGTTAVIGEVENVSVATFGGNRDIYIDGVSSQLSVDLQGTGNVLVYGSDHVLISGKYMGASGLIVFSQGNCTVKSEITASTPEDEMMWGGPPLDGIMSGCVKLPPDAQEGLDIAEYLYWTCGLYVQGSFTCLEGGVEGMPMPAPIPMQGNTRSGVTVLGRAIHGGPMANCQAGVSQAELAMDSVIDGMDLTDLDATVAPPISPENGFGVIEAQSA